MEGLLARVDPMAHSTSDHEAISGLVHLSPVQRRFLSTKLPKFNVESTEIFSQALIATAPPSLPFEEPTSQLIDAVASSGIAALGDPHLISEAHQTFRKTVKRAKREHKRLKLDSVSSIMEAHKVVGWRKFSSRFGPPLIQFQGVTYSTPTERADIFFCTKLARVGREPDVSIYFHTCPSRAIPAPLSIDEDEVRHCLLSTSSSTPGHGHLSVSALRLIWEVTAWRTWIVHLYSLCLVYGHHPSIFRRAEVVVIPKPHKDDLTNC
ncbi:hypothetical protein K3495_g14540 [Podosphaera aphanis]|nr:hypothetical protein K3495_g14540 [Podosphaera aphanis]